MSGQQLEEALATLRQERDALLEENRRLREDARDVAKANMDAAMKMVELSEVRRKELEEALALAEDASRRKDEFLAKISHELRTPLNGIIGMTTLLLQGGLEARQHSFAMTSLHASESLAVLIDDLLDLAQLESDHVQIDHVPFDPWRLAEAELRLAARASRREGVRLSLRIDPRLPRRVLGDPQRLSQVMSNLLGNALKFTDAGLVALRIRMSDDAADPSLLLEIEDTGCGISPTALERVFESFRQADDSTRRRYGGSGLGLAISRNLVELMGGTITAESEVGRGSVFRVVLPLTTADDDWPPRVDTATTVALMAPESDELSHATEHLRAVGVQTRTFPGVSDLVAWSTRHPERSTRHVLCDEGTPTPELERLRDAMPDLQIGEMTLRPDGVASKARQGVHCFSAPLAPTELLDWVLQDDAIRGRESAPSRSDRDQDPLRVLVAEDNAVNRLVAAKLLERSGCTVTLAHDGQAAFEKSALGDFDLVLMDCQMPNVDGYESTQWIREREARGGKHLFIVALTANAIPGDRERCMTAGMDDYLAKPLAVEELTRVLDLARERRQGRRAS